MATYKFGQIRKNQVQSFLTPLEYKLIDKEVESNLSKGVVFLDNAIELSGSNVLEAKNTQGKNKSYYLRFKIYKKNTKQIFDVKLINTDKNDIQQTIATIQIPPGEETDYSVFDIVISPSVNRIYNEIHFELARELVDYEEKNEKGYYGRLAKLEIENLSNIYNLIEFLNPSIENKGKLKQIGIQSAPGLMMCINGEQIQVGRTGIYELKNPSILIDFIGFIIEKEDNNYFILDYQY